MLMSALVHLHNMGHEILKIYTCKADNKTEFNTSIIEYAKQNNIPYTTNRIKINDLDELKSLGCELLICGWYYYLIPTPQNYEAEYFPMLNIHPAPLPEWRGSWPIPIMIRDGHKNGGVSIIKITEKMDEGDIVIQKGFEISQNENHQTYIEKSLICINEILDELMLNLTVAIRASMSQQQGTYWPAPTEKDRTIEADMTIEMADKILRGFYGYECIYTDGEASYEIIKAQASTECLDENVKMSREQGYFRVSDGYIKAPVYTML